MCDFILTKLFFYDKISLTKLVGAAKKGKMIDEKIKIQKSDFIFNHYVFETPKEVQFQIHSHNACEMIFFLRGNANYVIEDKRYKLKRNDIVLIHPNRYHYIEILDNEPYERYNVMFDDPELLRLAGDLIPEQLETLNCKDSIIAENFKKTDYYYSKFDEPAFIDLLRSLLKEIIYNLRIHSSENDTPAIVSPVLSSAIKYINENLFTVERISEISDKLHISETYFFKIFKEQLKISPKKYINDKRLLVAQKLLCSGKRPTEVYLQCGFQTYTSFYKQYMKLFGCSPSQLSIGPIIPLEENS